jgi:hypothetical protein
MTDARCIRPRSRAALPSKRLWVPITHPPQATLVYWWISPPRRSTRRPRTSAAGAGGGTAPCGGAWPSARGADAGCSALHSNSAISRCRRSRSSIPVQQLTTDCADPPLGEGVRWRCPHWRSQASEAKIASKVSVNLASRSRSRNRNCSMRSARSMRRLRLLGDPFPGWVGRQAKDVAPAGGDLQHEQHVQALERDGLSMEEVAGQIPSAWAARNWCQVRLARRGAGSIPHRWPTGCERGLVGSHPAGVPMRITMAAATARQ